MPARLAAEEYEALLESAPDGIVVVDEAGRILLVNRALEAMLGYRREELLGRSIDLLVPDRIRPLHRAHRDRFRADPRRRELGARLDLTARRKDGTELPVEVSLSPVENGAGWRVTAFVRDVSERRALEQERLALAREQATREEAEAGARRMAELLADVDVIVWEADDPTRRRFTFASRRAEGMLGYPLERWTSEDGFWQEAIHPDDRELVTSFFVGAAARGEAHELSYRMRAADGRVVWMRDLVRVVHDAEGKLHLRGAMVDMTDRLELEERLLHAQKLEAVGRLAGGVAHDFNNLLTVISGHASLLRGLVSGTAARESVDEIAAATQRAAELTTQLLAFSRRAPAAPERLDVGDLVRRVQGMLERLIGEDVELVVDAAPRRHYVRADRGQLEQVLINLVVNARDAMPTGGRVEIAVSSAPVDDESETGWVVISVTDTGVGMSEDVRAHVFEPFFTTKEEGKGTGLGLATVYGIVEQAGGHVEVASEVGHGSRFAVRLPRLGGRHEREPGGGRGTVLLVEDEPSLRRLARAILEEEGFRVLEAANGSEALGVVERHEGALDLLLTDVVMPELGGPELAARLAPLRPGLRVLYMSGYADSKLGAQRIENFAERALLKPFTPRELISRVERELGIGER